MSDTIGTVRVWFVGSAEDDYSCYTDVEYSLYTKISEAVFSDRRAVTFQHKGCEILLVTSDISSVIFEPKKGKHES